MNKALRGWRHKKRRTEEQFNREFNAFTAWINKHSNMRRIHQLGVTSPSLIHNGRKPR